MAFYLHDTKHVRELTRGLGPMWHWRAPIITPLQVAEAQARAFRAAQVVGLRREPQVVGLRRHGRRRRRGALSGGRIVDKRDPAPDELTTIDGKEAQRDCAAALQAMTDAAYRDGIKSPLLQAQSAYRASKLQEKLFAKAVKKYGSPQKARKWVAPPGESAHQSGCAFDLYLGVKMGTKPDQIAKLRATPAYKWLEKNAGRFGFAPYAEEPWHWECDASCKAEAKAKWGSLVQRGKARAEHALDVVKANPGKSGLGVFALLGLLAGAFFMLRKRT